MLDLLLSFVAMMLLAAVLLLAVGALTLLPLCVTLERAEEHGLDPTPWGWLWAGAVAVSGLVALVLRDALPVAVVLPAVVAWAVPLLLPRLRRLSPAAPGRHR